MAELSKVNVNSTDYDLKDQKSRDALVDVIDNGAKNLLQFDSLPSGTTTYTTAGVKFDILSDGSVKAERVSASTSVANAVLKIGGSNVYIDNFCNGKFILSGCPSGGGSSTYELMASITGGAYTKRDYGSGVLLTDKGSYSDIYVQCTVRSTFDGEVTFKPMLCTKAEWDISQDYVPYGMTNAELTAEKTDMIDVYGRGIEIPENADLHTYTTPGVYFSINSARTATLSNVPTYITAGFRLVVTEKTTVDGSRIRHDLYPIGTTYDNFYSENRQSTSTEYPDGWRPWVTYGPITTNPDSATLMNYMAPSAKKFYDDQQRQETEIGVVANAGAKNIFDIQAEAAIQRTTTVLNSDGGITISCNTASWATRNAIAEIPAGDYICSLFVDAVTIGGGTFGFFVNQSNNKSTWTELARQASITSTGRIDMPISVSQKYIRIATNINNSNTSATNSATIRLMLRPASITDHTFQPFARTNRELTVLTDEDRASLVELVDSGAKNVADMSKSTFTTSAKDGVTVTMSGDTITSTGTSGTATNQFHRILYDAGKLLIPAGTWIAALIGTGTDAFRIEVNSSSYSDLVKGTYGNPVQFTIPEGDTESYARITQKPSTNCAGTFKLMICTPAAWDISHAYQPYRPSYQELYDRIVALENQNT